MKTVGAVRHILSHVDLPNTAEAEQTMGMPIAKPHYWTVDDVWALPSDPRHRYEAVDGELLVSPSPRLSHQVAVVWLLRTLDEYVRRALLGCALSAPSDVVLGPRTIVQPDVYVLPHVNGRRAGDADPKPWPLLVVEVLSSSTAMVDRQVKRVAYQRAGFECWLVDLDARCVERWTPEDIRPEMVTEALRWQPVEGVAQLVCDVRALMNEVHGAA